MPDNHTRIPWRNKPAEDCPDGPRYKAIGNSMAVPVMRWIGERIELVENVLTEIRGAASHRSDGAP
jgi:DNA (cytosine-5)-methyltransferase 1